MTDALMPPCLAALPEPWSLSHPYASSAAIKAVPLDDTQRATALVALEHCLTYLTEDYELFGDELTEKLPEQFSEVWPFFSRKLIARMPHFADVSYVNVRQWLIEDVDASVLFGESWTVPSPEIVAVVGQFWVRRVVGRLTMNLMRWLRRAYRDNATAPDKSRMLTMLKAAAPRLTWSIGQRAVAVVWDLSKPAGEDFLATMAKHSEAPQQTREEAARLLAYAEGSEGRG